MNDRVALYKCPTMVLNWNYNYKYKCNYNYIHCQKEARRGDPVGVKIKKLTEGGCTCSKCQKKDGHGLYVVARGMASLSQKPMMRFPLNHIAPLYSKNFRDWKFSSLLENFPTFKKNSPFFRQHF